MKFGLSLLQRQSLTYPPCFKGTLIVKSRQYCPWSLLASQGYVLYSAGLLWHSQTVMQETLQKFGCQSPLVSVIPPVDLFGAAHSSVSQFWTLTWHSWDHRKWVWDFSTSCIYFRLNTWSFPWKVGIDKNWLVAVAEPESGLQWTAECAVGNFFYQMPIPICKQASDAVRCH